ncbi:DUF3052 family protein [Frondihabitans australicus]|uniref:DUF3052 family protein n=1 Tax=Frondihabitans australicus TaxID=386892 RepID=A0A495IKK2_9MICO|nr:DUF3052 family protein [Frondihabitans australicus]RKR76497.1 hypothetical protein C8E83_3674 [Frondihabitans australicus]
MVQSTAVKLGVKQGSWVAAWGIEQEQLLTLLGPLPDQVEVSAVLADEAPDESAQIVLLFADTVDDVHARIEAAWQSTAALGRLWVAYRKGARPLHRDTLQEALAVHGLNGVTLVALDGEWSAMRVRPA